MVWNTDGILRGNNMLLIIGTVYMLNIDEVHEPVSPCTYMLKIDEVHEPVSP